MSSEITDAELEQLESLLAVLHLDMAAGTHEEHIVGEVLKLVQNKRTALEGA